MSTSGEPRSRLRLLFAVSLLALALFIGMRADDTLAGFTVGRLPQTGAPVLTGQPVSSGTGRQAPFDCSQIKALGIDRQTNIRAAQIMRECSGQARSSEPRLPFPLTPFKNVFSPLDLGSGDVDIITDPEDWPYVTQSESSVWSKGDEHIVVAYNDSSDTRNGNFSGISYSMDGGNRFERIHPFNSDHTYNLGNPMVVFNQALNTGQGKWFAGDLVSDSSGGCGGQGIGMWSSLDSITWTLAPCAHSSFNDDRPSMWVDNNSSSFYYGRMYVSFNNFTILNSLQVVYSDNGTVWHSAVTLSNSGYRNMQITGGPDGAVYVTAMDENGGGLNPRTHHIYKSTNGGVNWTHSTIVSGVAAPGNALCQSNNYFPIITPIWRYMGWGQAGVGPSGVIHYAYGAHGLLGDEGDIYYVRSTDNGSTWSNPIRLNADVTLREQWMPSLSVNSLGAVTVGWYDRRNTTDGENYEYRAIVSTNNGLDWGDDEAVSDGLIPQPEQPDPNFPDCYAGDFNRHFATDNNAFLTWTDGRVLGGGRSQQDIFFDKIAVSSPTPTYTPTGTPPTATPTPTCGSSPHYIISELHNVPMANGSSLVAGSRCDECTVDISLPFSHALYCNTFAVAHIGSNGTIGFVSSNNPYSNVCLPHNAFDHVIAAHWDDLDMSPSAGSGLGVYTSLSGTAPHRTFNVEWRACRYHGGDCGGYVNFTVRLHEGSTTFEVIYGAVANNGHSATLGVQGDGTDPVTEHSCNSVELDAGLELQYRLSYALLGTTVTPTSPPTNTPTTPPGTPTSTPTCGPEPRYNFVQASGTVVPATNVLPDSSCHNCVLRCELPFAYLLYGQSYTSVYVDSNGVLQFSSSPTPPPTDSRHTCSLDTASNYSIFAHWDDLDMSSTVSSTLGVYTSVTGIAPGRIFNIEWRACRYSAGECGGYENFEVRLYEGQEKFDIIYGTVEGGGTNASVGSSGGTPNQFTSYSCDENKLRSGLLVAFQQMCTLPSPTATNTATPTPVLVGHVSWQARPPQPSALQQLPITLTLKSSLTEVNYPIMTTNASGYFTVSVSGLATGVYNWRVKSAQVGTVQTDFNPGWLARSGSVSLTGSYVTSAEMGIPLSGDGNNDNVVNTSDFVLLKNTFGKGIGQSGYDNRADFTGDTAINTSDFVALKNNFGVSGAPPIRP